MATKRHQSSAEAQQAWALTRAQHGLVTRAQLASLGFTEAAIKHRIATGRLHRVARGVYVVGRAEVSRRGEWMAAILACGPGAVLSHDGAAALWEIRKDRARVIEVSVRATVRRSPGVRVHRRSALAQADISCRDGIPVTSPACTLIDLAPRLGERAWETAVNEADKLDLIHPDELRDRLAALAGRPGVAHARRMLDRRAFRLTRSELERRFLALVRGAGLPLPQTGAIVAGFEVDFFWAELGLVVETDGLRYHRTPSEQARDRLRDQAHAAAGLTPLRFTHAQVRYQPERVISTLAARGRAARGRPAGATVISM
jgi:very-short-patch-repair endonuclease